MSITPDQINTIIGIIVGALTILGIVGSALVFIYRLIKARQDIEKTRREFRREDLLKWMSQLQESIAKYDQWIVTRVDLWEDAQRSQHSEIIGKARAALLAIGDEQLETIANKVLTPYFVISDDGSDAFKLYGEYQNRNRNGLSESIKRLAQLVKEAS